MLYMQPPGDVLTGKLIYPEYIQAYEIALQDLANHGNIE